MRQDGGDYMGHGSYKRLRVAALHLGDARLTRSDRLGECSLRHANRGSNLVTELPDQGHQVRIVGRVLPHERRRYFRFQPFAKLT